MAENSNQSPTTVDKSDTEDTTGLHPAVTGAQQRQDEDNDPVGTLGNAKHVDDSMGHQEDTEAPADSPETYDAVGGNCAGHAGRTCREHTKSDGCAISG